MAPVDPLLDAHAAWIVSLSPGSAGRDALLVETLRFQHVGTGQRWLTILIAAERLIILELLVVVPTFHACPVGAIHNACSVPLLALSRDGTALLDRRRPSITPRFVQARGPTCDASEVIVMGRCGAPSALDPQP